MTEQATKKGIDEPLTNPLVGNLVDMGEINAKLAKQEAIIKAADRLEKVAAVFIEHNWDDPDEKLMHARSVLDDYRRERAQ